MADIKHLNIDFVSDVVCPWCAIGLKSLEQALQRLDGQVTAELHFQPFELNPDMVPGGEDVIEHISHKYGSTPEQIVKNQEGIRRRGASVGFTFDMDRRQRIYNTFDAHRLLHWAQGEGRQAALKLALMEAYFSKGEDVGSHEVLARVAGEVGLDVDQARELLESGRYAQEVRAQERFFQEQGIRAVPSVIVNGRYLIQGGQPPEVFEQTLRQIASEV
ncbi:MAG TPA: DsbA family oxidoreductase [Dyella sp.]|uniref:DsbA family oxidoreductase n=1 Tax=Dyella sp. TaxID=1869338 RepID=UPI002C1FB940|nr:DsbA family oxidoreductase [Dyella sp.]HTV85127.1 DsbA family oxidoreductase [Dyella sp.]